MRRPPMANLAVSCFTEQTFIARLCLCLLWAYFIFSPNEINYPTNQPTSNHPSHHHQVLLSSTELWILNNASRLFSSCSADIQDRTTQAQNFDPRCTDVMPLQSYSYVNLDTWTWFSRTFTSQWTTTRSVSNGHEHCMANLDGRWWGWDEGEINLDVAGNADSRDSFINLFAIQFDFARTAFHTRTQYKSHHRYYLQIYS